MHATDTYEWLPGEYFLLHRWDARFPESRTEGLEIIGYDESTGDFFMHSYDSEGNVGIMRAEVDGDCWSFVSDLMRFSGGFSDDGAVFSGIWQQRRDYDSDWTPWMDITLRRAA